MFVLANRSVRTYHPIVSFNASFPTVKKIERAETHEIDGSGFPCLTISRKYWCCGDSQCTGKFQKQREVHRDCLKTAMTSAKGENELMREDEIRIMADICWLFIF